MHFLLMNSTASLIFFLQETVLKFHAQAKRWIAYTVLTGSLAVVAVTGILVGLYLTGNLDRSKSKEKGSQSVSIDTERRYYRSI